MDHAAVLANQRERRRRNGNLDTSRYERLNPKGFLMRVYRNMLSRVTGIQKRKAHLYRGMAILPKTEFYEWAQAQESFWALWRSWQAADRDRCLCPSIDRIDATQGYVVENMQWLTHSENSTKALIERYS